MKKMIGFFYVAATVLTIRRLFLRRQTRRARLLMHATLLLQSCNNMREYSREDLDRDIWLMVKAGLLEYRMREDGEWVFSVTEKSKSMTDDEKEAAIHAVLEEEGLL